MNTTKITSALLLTLALVGCANLKEVRDYAGESARLSAYMELTARFRDTYYREQPYLSGEPDRLAQDNDKRRKAAYEDLLKIHQRASLYMQTLATLAGEDTFDISKEVDSLASGIKAYPDFGINEKHVDAISNIAKVITKWMTSSYQERAVHNMVKEGDAPLQTTLEGMISLVRYYKKTNENERKTVLGFFEVEIPYADAPKDKLLATLARVHVQSKESEYKDAQQKYDDAEKGIKSIAGGHKRLLENIDKLSNDEVKATISKFAKDIKTIRKNLQTVRG
ncbi:MAG: hypothetical protein EPN14_09405 [Gallionella sp.]|nr:MAG: hypothetical protein EPN14_09405 [Gallionella sp.]